MALESNSRTSWWNWQDTTSDEGLDYFKRIAGADRYETMKKIVQASYKWGDNWWTASVAVVASGDNFPDALAANGLAGALNNGNGAPVILTNKGKLNSHAKELLQKLGVQTVYIMGGTAAVSEDVESAIRDMKIATVRVSGEDRQATSVRAFNLIDGNWYKYHGTHSVIIATGANYADALSIAPFAYRTGTPIVLTKADGTLSDEAIKAIKDNDEIYQVIVVGGTAAVSDSVFGALGTYNGSYKDYYNKVYIPVRIAGADRYDTSAKIADWEVNYALDPNTQALNDARWRTAGFSFDEVFVATGENFPDALAGGQLAGGLRYVEKDVTLINFKNRRWEADDWAIIQNKGASPILLTKDGNRAADAVIASNLSWNATKVSIDSYDFVADVTAGTSLANFLWAYGNGQYSDDVALDGALGFFTNTQIAVGAVFNPALNGNYFDGYRVDDSNFAGTILGGKAAVSKAKAEQLDETVDDSIQKWVDHSAASYNADTITIDGRTYYTMYYYLRNLDTAFNVVGVDETWSRENIEAKFTSVLNGRGSGLGADFTIAVPVNNYRYFYGVVDMTAVPGTQAYSATTGALNSEDIVITLAEFDRNAAFTSFANDMYTGYGFTGYRQVRMNYNYNALTPVAAWTASTTPGVPNTWAAI
jgi:putative cell wall-binding protein